MKSKRGERCKTRNRGSKEAEKEKTKKDELRSKHVCSRNNYYTHINNFCIFVNINRSNGKNARCITPLLYNY